MDLLAKQHRAGIRIYDDTGLCLDPRVGRPVRLPMGGHGKKLAYHKAAA